MTGRIIASSILAAYIAVSFFMWLDGELVNDSDKVFAFIVAPLVLLIGIAPLLRRGS